MARFDSARVSALLSAVVASVWAGACGRQGTRGDEAPATTGPHIAPVLSRHADDSTAPDGGARVEAPKFACDANGNPSLVEALKPAQPVDYLARVGRPAGGAPAKAT